MDTANKREELSDFEINAKLRERTIRFWISVIGQPLEGKTFEKYNLSKLLLTNLRTTVTGTLGAIDSKQELVQISNLQTPLFLYPEALLRSHDLHSISLLRNKT